MACSKFVVGGLLAAGLAAQSSFVVPASHAAREGTSSTNVPFGRSTPTRVQSCYDPLNFAGPVTITSLAFRTDGGIAANAKAVDCEVRMSTMAGDLLALSADFAANRGNDETLVLPRLQRNLPSVPAGGSPSAFLPAWPLATPFAYDPAQGSLLVEVLVYGQPPGAYSLDLTYACDSPEIAVGPAACQPPGTVPLRVESSTTQVMWGRPWVVRVLDAPPGALVTLVLGSRDSGAWQGFSLPQDLAPLGAPGCWLSIDVVTSQFGFALGDGSAPFPFVVPNLPAAVGSWFRFQAGALVPQANALGVVTSQAKKVEVCGWEPVGRVWASGLTASAGTLEIGVAPVVQFGL